jgi:Protein of unknown function (DUF4038)/Domain of unknown function (DUF5060)/Putative collagen-binding domain of a collagenase
MERNTMRNVISKRRRTGVAGVWAAGWCCLALPLGLGAASQPKPTAIIAKWARFEQSFLSTVRYANPMQDVSLKVSFISPLGETNLVDGFWDGENTWRVRFSPNLPGRWTFETACTDASNAGLDHRAGEFLCSAAIGQTRFHQHGLVQVARDHRHLEHADGTPFFWLADTAWGGAREAEAKQWEVYAQARSYQKYSVIQWAVGPGVDSHGMAPIASFGDHIAINPEFFQRLDAKVDILTEAGLLSAIVPLLEMPPPKEIIPLPDKEVAVLVRYLEARWGADPVVWLLAFDGGTPSDLALRWKRIGQLAFGAQPHAPVMVCPGTAFGALDAFRHEPWVDMFGCQVFTQPNDATLASALTGPLAKEWTNSPPRPFIPLLPRENSASPQIQKPFAAGQVRRAAYWSVLMSASAGVSYGGEGIADWSPSLTPPGTGSGSAALPIWLRTLSLPAGEQVGYLGEWLNSLEYWRLRPQPDAVATQPGHKAPQRYIAAAATEDKDLVLAYVPADRSVDLVTSSLPVAPTANWLNPRTGEILPAVAAVSGNNCQFSSPGPGDWLLLVRGTAR